MMSKSHKYLTLQSPFSEVRLAQIYDVIDRMHDVASQGELAECSTLSSAEVLDWLREIAFTLNETINELEAPSNIKWDDLMVMENKEDLDA